MAEHTILMAFTIEAEDRAEAQALLMHGMNPGSMRRGWSEWWIAEDDRADGSDNDSAVFVHPGRQHDATALLLAKGMTDEVNLIDRARSFEGARWSPPEAEDWRGSPIDSTGETGCCTCKAGWGERCPDSKGECCDCAHPNVEH